MPVDAAAGVFPILSGRAEAFPGGESLDALRARAARDVLDALLMPHVWRARGGEATVACVSHGLCISELCAAILERAPDDVGKRYAFAGLANTAWHCLRIGMKVRLCPPIPSVSDSCTKGEERGEAGTGEMDVNAPLTVEVVKMNESAHLKTIVRVQLRQCPFSLIRSPRPPRTRSPARPWPASCGSTSAARPRTSRTTADVEIT